MTRETYRTVAGPGEAGLRVRGSKFIGSIDHVPDEPGAVAVIVAVETEYADATHVVPAYRIRADPFREYASDAGEPSGSAGDPILTVLRGEELENVVAVVVRYYGGTNLGIGGLVRAYQDAIKRAIEDAGVVDREPRNRLVVETTYDDSGTVRAVLESSDATFTGSYEETVRFAVDVPVASIEAVTDRLRDATSGRVSISDET